MLCYIMFTNLTGVKFLKEKNQHKLNNEITSGTITLIDDHGVMLGDKTLSEALQIAQEKELDLVEMKEDKSVSICKLLNYGKFLYQQNKNKKQSSHKAKPMKEIKLRPVTEKADLETKVNHIKDFLTAGHPVKINVVFKGRELNMISLGENVMNSIIEEIKEFSTMKKEMHRQGKSLVTMIDPIKN
jgi:translation initiation factor IF-3